MADPSLDYDHRTALEFISLQNRERTHAEVLAWLLSEHSRLGPSRADVLVSLLGAAALGAFPAGDPGWASQVHTEHVLEQKSRVDLLAIMTRRGERHVLVVEFKMGSIESPDQLSRYDRALPQAIEKLSGRHEPGSIKIWKVLLTVAGDAPRSGAEWLARTYGDLRSALLRAEPPAGTEGDETRRCLEDYQLMLARLEGCLERARTDAAFAGAIVVGGRRARLADARSEAMLQYVMEMSLGTLVGRAWLLRLLDQAGAARLETGPWEIHSGKRIKSGGALLNIHLARLTTPTGLRVLHGLQFQAGKVRAFIEPILDAKLDAKGAEQANALHRRLLWLKSEKPERWSGGVDEDVAQDEAGHRSIRLLDGALPVGSPAKRSVLSVAEWVKALEVAVKLTREDIGPQLFEGVEWDQLGGMPARLSQRSSGGGHGKARTADS